MLSKVARDFGDFIREQGVVGLAVGFVLGAAVKDVVSSLVDNIINPLLGLAIGQADSLRAGTLMIRGVEVRWGDFVATVLDFIIIAVVVYYFVKVLNAQGFDKKKE